VDWGTVAEVAIPAAAGLIGAGVGGYPALRAARETMAANERRRREHEAIEARAGARLVRDDLVRVQASIDFALREGRWIEEEVRPQSWESHAAVLARTLDDEEWRVVTGAIIIGRHQARDLADALQSERGSPYPSPDAERMILEWRLEEVRMAIEVLDRYVTVGALISRPLVFSGPGQQ
jgi:hypothetical protein